MILYSTLQNLMIDLQFSLYQVTIGGLCQTLLTIVLLYRTFSITVPYITIIF
jgi:hypothetical protein